MSTCTSNRTRTVTWRLLGLIQVAALILSLVVPLLPAVTPPAYADPAPNWNGNTVGGALHFALAPWPSTWTAYTRKDSTINDPRTQDPSNGGTTPQNYVNVSSSCTDKAQPSVYYAYDSAFKVAHEHIPGIGTTYFTYDPAAETTTVRDPLGNRTYYGFDGERLQNDDAALFQKPISAVVEEKLDEEDIFEPVDDPAEVARAAQAVLAATGAHDDADEGGTTQSTEAEESSEKDDKSA